MSSPSALVRRGLTALALALVATPVAAQDALSIMSEMFTRQQMRWAGIENFTIVTEMAGSRIPQYFEAIPLEGGQTFRLVPLTEIQRRHAAEMGAATPSSGELAAMADGYAIVGELVASELEREGIPVLPGMTREFAGMASEFLQVAADYEENDGVEDARQRMAGLAQFARNARLVGTEEVGGRSAFHLRMDDFSEIEMPEDEIPFSPTRASLWIDTELYVPLRMLVEGDAETEDGPAPLTVERISTGWSDDQGLLLPGMEIMRLGGIMSAASDEERAQMAEAVEQLAEMREQLDALPPAQKEMIMGRFGPQMEQLERMAAGEPFAVESWLVEVRVDEGPPYDLAEIVLGGAGGGG